MRPVVSWGVLGCPGVIRPTRTIVVSTVICGSEQNKKVIF